MNRNDDDDDDDEYDDDDDDMWIDTQSWAIVSVL